jgi:TctA family transporter
MEELLPTLIALVGGTAIGFFLGLVPGLGGRLGLILCLPIAALFHPYAAAIFLFALHSVMNTSSSIPNIAFGVPTSSGDAATILDGYPLTKMGRGGEALGASLSASAIGGVLGALAFLISIPVARPLVTSFGPPELLMLAILGVAMVSSLSSEGLLQGLVVAVIGMIFGMVGIDGRTGELRFTFDSMSLWDGVGLPAVVCGIFVIPEMLSTQRRPDDESFDRAMSTRISDVYRGMFITLRYRAVLLRSTLYGILVGLMPAVGSTIGVWMSYAYAARTTKSEIPFGQGAIAGVIAPEAANNSKEGGAMIPTLFFGIPGSSGMAVMMAALAYVGVAVGPNMLTANIDLSFLLAATVLLANLIAVPFFFAVVPSIVKLSALRQDAIVPIAVAISFTASLIDAPTLATVLQVFVASAIGVALKLANWPRAPFILGFVILEMGESSYFLTAELWGWTAFQRPLTLFLAIVVVGWLAYSIRTRPPIHISGRRSENIFVSLALICFFALTVYLSLGLSTQVGLAPIVLSGISIALCALILIAAFRERKTNAVFEPVHHIAWTGLYIISTPILGLFGSSIAYIAIVLAGIGISRRNLIVILAVFAAVQFVLLTSVFDVLIEREILGRITWAALGH